MIRNKSLLTVAAEVVTNLFFVLCNQQFVREVLLGERSLLGLKVHSSQLDAGARAGILMRDQPAKLSIVTRVRLLANIANLCRNPVEPSDCFGTKQQQQQKVRSGWKNWLRCIITLNEQVCGPCLNQNVSFPMLSCKKCHKKFCNPNPN